MFWLGHGLTLPCGELLTLARRKENYYVDHAEAPGVREQDVCCGRQAVGCGRGIQRQGGRPARGHARGDRRGRVRPGQDPGRSAAVRAQQGDRAAQAAQAAVVGVVRGAQRGYPGGSGDLRDRSQRSGRGGRSAVLRCARPDLQRFGGGSPARGWRGQSAGAGVRQAPGEPDQQDPHLRGDQRRHQRPGGGAVGHESGQVLRARTGTLHPVRIRGAVVQPVRCAGSLRSERPHGVHVGQHVGSRQRGQGVGQVHLRGGSGGSARQAGQGRGG